MKRIFRFAPDISYKVHNIKREPSNLMFYSCLIFKVSKTQRFSCFVYDCLRDSHNGFMEMSTVSSFRLAII